MVLEAAAGQRRALFHAQQTQTGAAHGLFPNAGHIKADAIIAHGQMELLIVIGWVQLHGYGARFGMFDHVG
jgi:hypothetical protein